MPSNAQLIEKAAMTLSDLASGGRLNVQQSNKFLRMVQDAPTLVKQSRFVPMESDRRKVEKLGFGNRILRVGQEGTALAESDRAVPQTDMVTLNTKEVIAEINITYDTLENNIEKGNLQNTIMQMIAERAALDIEELVINGDTASTDPYLALLDGLRAQATSHIFDAVGVAANKYGPREVLKQLKKIMPSKYLRNPAMFRYFVSHNLETEWKDAIGFRETAWGDQALSSAPRASAYGVPVEPLAMLQDYAVDPDGTVSTGDEFNGSDILLTHPKNILVGMNRNITVEVDKDIRERKFIIVLTAKVDAKFEEEDAVAKAVNVNEDITSITTA